MERVRGRWKVDDEGTITEVTTPKDEVAKEREEEIEEIKKKEKLDAQTGQYL